MSLIRKLRDRLQGATLHDLWVETRWVLHHSKRYRRLSRPMYCSASPPLR